MQEDSSAIGARVMGVADMNIEVAMGENCDMMVDTENSAEGVANDAHAPVDESITSTTRASSSSSMEDMSVEVRWMASGVAACSVSATTSTMTAEVKLQVQEQSGVPVDEQRLFLGDRELLPRDAVARTSPSSASVPPLLLVRSEIDPRATNLAHFIPTEDFAPIPVGSFQRVRKLADAIHGTVYLKTWNGDGCGEPETAVVKTLENHRINRHRSKESSELNIHLGKARVTDFEDSLTEIGVLAYLSKLPNLPLYLLKMLGVFADEQETWLVTEFCEGGELFSTVAAGPVLDSDVRRYTWQLLQAIAFLDAHSIGHRDISLENILLKDGNIRLMDYGMAVQSYSVSGTPLRYFCAVGKDFYRAPECYVPSGAEASVVVPRVGVSPGDVISVSSAGFLCEVKLPKDANPGCICKAELWGYRTPPADVFSAGICMFILGAQVPPWHKAVLSDPGFSYVRRQGAGGLAALLRSWNKAPFSGDAMQLLTGMLQLESQKRHTVADCLASPWFAPLRDTSIPVHTQHSQAALGGA